MLLPHFQVQWANLFAIANAAADSSTPRRPFKNTPCAIALTPVYEMAGPLASCAFYRDKISKNEGRRYLDYLAGHERALSGKSLDVVFLAFGFDHQPRTTTGSEEEGPCAPQIAELGVACLDTRRLNHPATVHSSVSEGPMVEIWRYKAAEQGFADHELATILTRHFRLQDANSPDPDALRSVVLVGSPTWSDFNLLERIGVDFSSLAPIVTSMDVSTLRGQLFPSAKEDFTPAAFVQWLQPDSSPGPDLGAAATQAAYALHALLRLAIKRAEASTLAQYPLPAENSEALACLRQAAATRPRLAEAGPKGADFPRDHE